MLASPDRVFDSPNIGLYFPPNLQSHLKFRVKYIAYQKRNWTLSSLVNSVVLPDREYGF